MADKKNSRGRGLTGQSLKEFRHKVSVLKSKGLVRKSVQARSQKPTKYMRAKVRSLADVLSGTNLPVKRSPKVAREYKLAGFRVVNNRVILNKEQAVRTRNSHNEWLTLEKMTNGGTIERRVIMPVGVTNIDTFLADEDRIEKLIRPGRRLAFTYFGNRSLQTFVDATSLMLYLQNYSVIAGNKREKEQAWRHLVLFDIREDRAASWESETQALSKQRARNRKRPRRLLANGREDIRERPKPLTYAEVKARDAAHKRKMREKETEDQAEQRRRINRERMRGYRAKRKGE